ncbi:MAG: hypothetical protein OXI91_13145 [Chloroflexota bacterium]|nr:hypothetical protein [Chloroflexota bacterium]
MTAPRRKIDQIDGNFGLGTQPSEYLIAEAAFWARAVLDIVGPVNLRQYGHNVRKTLHTTRSVADPEHPDSAKAVLDGDTIGLEKFLGAIIHFRYFAYIPHADGNHCLDVKSDETPMTSVYYSEFIRTLRSVALPHRFAALALCDLVERDLGRRDRGLWRPEDDWIFPGITLFSLLYDHIRNDVDLKKQILQQIFGIQDVPENALSGLFFAESRSGPGKEMVISFGPPWEAGQDRLSPPFNRSLLFGLIRDFYRVV